MARFPSPTCRRSLQGNVSTYTYAPSYTPLSWRSIEGAFFAEDAVKVRLSLELRFGFRGESTNGWNEAQDALRITRLTRTV